MKTATKSATKTPGCPIAKASEIIGDTWTILIIRELLGGTKRFNEIQQDLISSCSQHCINSRTLTERLKKLEKENVLERTVVAHEMPPRVEYTLTKKGKDLSKVIEALKNFGEKHL